ncbi:hypothetical protein UFOVP1090_33 [uncultured Caudovirales phage]|uniref:Uncharacterized protein n=1 Tax=uncultured Caudovirales phage TaxID=2100421 RepID=A0A6J5QGT7_9CAUD|nr:hypothetical protein UFOVP1090_33 [uncultured Caudovirales phage]
MATYKSSQVTKIDSVDYDMLKSNEAHGRMRVVFFDFTTPASGNADGDIYELCEIPIGARILRMKTANTALGASVVAKIGIVGADTKYGSALDLAAAGADDFLVTVAQNYGLELIARERLIMTLTGAAPAASQTVRGHVEYVID